MSYKFTQEVTIEDFSENNIESLYKKGFKFVRKQKGLMQQTLSLRIVLDDNFEFNSENRRIKRKTEFLKLEAQDLPLNSDNYDFKIHKIGKDFYKKIAGDEIFSASKIKELVTDPEKSNFNLLLSFADQETNETIGYCICYKSQNILHYSYPFYSFETEKKNIGMGMIINAIQYCLDDGIKYFYLGSVDSEKSLYKLQFENMEWWDDNSWSKDIEKLKKLIKDD
jgi:arginyl-tRNA--protein-N-Asp/Glu arginylyltransferase